MKKLSRHPESIGIMFRRMLVILVLFLVLGLGVGAYLVFFTGVFSVKQVTFSGNRVLPSQHLHKLSGIDNYRNLLTLPVGAVEQNLEKDPWIKDVTICRKLPGTVQIEVEERDPVALADFGGATFLVDGNAYVVSKEDPQLYGHLPRIGCGDCSVPRVDTKVGNKVLRRAIQLLGSMPIGLRAEISLVNPFDGRGLVLVSRSGYLIVYGQTDERERKDEILEAIVVDIESKDRNVAYVDIRVPDSPVVKMK